MTTPEPETISDAEAVAQIRTRPGAYIDARPECCKDLEILHGAHDSGATTLAEAWESGWLSAHDPEAIEIPEHLFRFVKDQNPYREGGAA